MLADSILCLDERSDTACEGPIEAQNECELLQKRTLLKSFAFVLLRCATQTVTFAVGRRERAADASTSGNEALRSPGAARRSLSPRNWQQQQPPSASGRNSAAAVVAGAAGSAAGAGGRSTASAGMKRRLSSATAAAPNPGSQIGERSGIGGPHNVS